MPYCTGGRGPRRRSSRRTSTRWIVTIADGCGSPCSGCSRSRRGCARSVKTPGLRSPRRPPVLPDRGAEHIVADAIASAIRRARLMAIGESVAWGLAAAAVSLAAGAVIAAGVAVWRWRAASRGAIVRRLERASADSRNLFVTADEIANDRLVVKPIVRARVFADAASSAARVDPRRLLPFGPLLRAVLIAAVAWTAVQTAHLWRPPLSRAASGIAVRSTPASAAPAASRLRVSVAIHPPPYTALKETTAVDPEQLQMIEGSTLVLSIEASAARVTIEHEGRTRSLAPGQDGRFIDRRPVTKTGYLAIVAGDGRRTIPLVVVPDALPVVRLTAPGRDLVYAGGNALIAFDARATDDFGLRSLVLRYTKVTGSGENYEFEEGEIPLAVTAVNARDWKGAASRSLADLKLRDGDMLVYRAVAADARPGDRSASSDAFFIEISKLGVAAGDAFTLPEEESKYALSQQMLIVKTERLQQRRASIAADAYSEQALNLAVEQRMIRAEFVFMLGGEINDEEVEAEQSVELQAGRLQNRGQRDLRTATTAMSQAEKLLTGSSTAEALVAERAAVAALQRAFSRDRYILRAMATRSPLDPARRLTGELGDAAGWRRVPPDAPVNRRAALLQDLLRGIAELAGSDQGPRALVLAGEAILIDPSPASLRQAATELRRAAATTDAAARSTALAAAAAGAAAEARRAHADPPLVAPGLAPALTGAFDDALRRRR